MAVQALDLTRNNWREYAFATDRVLRERANLAFNHSPTLGLFASQRLVERTGRNTMEGRGRRVQEGGPAILRFVTLGAHQGAAFVSGGFGEHTLSPDENDRPSEANWKFLNHALVVSQHDLNVNRGPTRFASFLDRQMSNVLKSAADLLADALWSVAPIPNAPVSIPALLSANDAVQGLSGQTYLPWNSRGLSNVGTAPASITFSCGSFAAQGISNMRRLWNNAEEGGVGPEVSITTYEVSEFYEASLQPQQRFTGAVRTPDGGFTGIAFRGTPILPDRKCASGQMAVLNVSDRENGIQMDFLEGAAFNFLDWKPAMKQTAMIRPLIATCNLSIGNRQFGSNRMDSITA